MKLPPEDCVDCLKGVINDEPIFGERFDYSVFSDCKPVDELVGWEGSSVNWDLTDGGALEELLKRTKKGHPQFKAGVIRIPRSEIDKIIKRYGSDILGYELREDNGNKYHGNILFSLGLKPRQKTTITSLIVNAYVMHYKQDE